MLNSLILKVLSSTAHAQASAGAPQNPYMQFLPLVVVFVIFYFLMIRPQKKKFEEEQKRMSDIHQLDIDKAENELIRLRNEKLQNEVDYKNSELATNAMHLVQKGELLNKIKSEL